jgi:hypothetical protein
MLIDSQKVYQSGWREAHILGWGWNQADSLRLAGDHAYGVTAS